MVSQPIRIQLGKILRENLAGKILREILAVKILREMEEGKSQFKKGSDWWKFRFGIGWWGDKPIRIQLGKILQEIVAGKSCGKSCGKFLRNKILWEILAGKSCGKWRRGKSQFKKGSDWWKFSIWNRVMGSQPIRIQLGKILRENLTGNSCWKCCGKILQEMLWEILWEIWWEMLWDIFHTYPQAVFEGNFQNMQFI